MDWGGLGGREGGMALVLAIPQRALAGDELRTAAPLLAMW